MFLQNNISAEVIDLRTLSPLDLETLVNSVKKTSRAVVIEETGKQADFLEQLLAIFKKLLLTI